MLKLFGVEDGEVYTFTWFGKILYYLSLGFSIFYLYFLNGQLQQNNLDNYKSVEELNVMTDELHKGSLNHKDDEVKFGEVKSLEIVESNNFYLNDLNFLPFFDLRLLNLISPDKLDIYSNPDEIR